MTSHESFGKEYSAENYHDSRMSESNVLMDIRRSEVVIDCTRVFSLTKPNQMEVINLAFVLLLIMMITAGCTNCELMFSSYFNLFVQYVQFTYTYQGCIQGVIQSTTILRRPVYVRSQKELGVTTDVL